MKYRVNRKTGDRISEIGLGSAYLYEAGTEEAVRALRTAYKGGINFFDLAAGNGSCFPMYGEALHEVRKNIFYQIHFGADYTGGDYGWSMDLETVKRSVAKMLKELRTDYIDYGFIHCQDELSDWESFQNNGIYQYLLDLKQQGVVRHIGLSSHTPSVIRVILEEADPDILMFSVNPGYDCGEGEYARGETEEREEIYRLCEKKGIGISVMKPFSGGQMLDASISPFGVALTPYQCMKYALDKPGVLTVLPGASDEAEVKALLAYYDKTEEELDYSVLGTVKNSRLHGRCVYCNHCKPCPAGIDIGLVNKYYDLAMAGDALAVTHYRTLDKNAEACMQCGHCDSRCPFGVKQSLRMTEIRERMAKK